MWNVNDWEEKKATRQLFILLHHTCHFYITIFCKSGQKTSKVLCPQNFKAYAISKLAQHNQ